MYANTDSMRIKRQLLVLISLEQKAAILPEKR